MKKIKKYKEFLLYLIFGAITTFISIAVFYCFNVKLDINEHIANIISWIFAVLFAFLTNRGIVFNSKTKTKAEFISQIIKFYCGRLSTLLIEELIIFIFITILSFNSMAVKTICQIVVIILNFYISKYLVFNKKELP